VISEIDEGEERREDRVDYCEQQGLSWCPRNLPDDACDRDQTISDDIADDDSVTNLRWLDITGHPTENRDANERSSLCSKGGDQAWQGSSTKGSEDNGIWDGQHADADESQVDCAGNLKRAESHMKLPIECVTCDGPMRPWRRGLGISCEASIWTGLGSRIPL
jgi:hypothetical protein